MKKPFSVPFVVLFFALTLLPAAAQDCDRSGCGRASCATPAVPVPADRWQGLRPLDAAIPPCTEVGPAFCRDSSSFDEFRQRYANFPWFMSVDTENGYLFVALAHGLQVWDARSFPPEPKSQLTFGAFPVWSSNPEVKWPLQDADAPAGVDDEVALAGQSGIGLVVVDTADKSEPRVLYQSHRKEGFQVYAAVLGGRRFAFLASPSGEPSGGLYAYDLTRAKLFDSCSEGAPAVGEPIECPGVFLGRIGAQTSVSFVDGVDHFVVDSTASSGRLEIWDVATPASPRLALSHQIEGSMNGVAMWKQGSTYYLAARTVAFEGVPGRIVHRTSIYDVSCVASACSGLGPAVSSVELDGGGGAEFVDFSRSDGVPFLYLGSDNRCSGGTQREWLFDVSDPAHPQEISPFDYWGWYYRGGPTGFNLVMPRSGKFVGPVFYRAALSLFDFHQRTGLTGGGRGTAIFVDGPASGQLDTELSFRASGTGCTPGASGWVWSVGDGTIVSVPGDSSMVSVKWSTAGMKPISVRHPACGSAVGLQSVTIAGSAALGASFTFSPSTPRPGQVVEFDAGASTGDPSQFSWNFGDDALASGKLVHHTFASGGAYTVRLTIGRPGPAPGCSMAFCSDSTQKLVVVVADAPPPPDASFQTSASCVSQFGFDRCSTEPGATVSFTANSTTAASYQWNFGDGTTGSGRTVSHVWTQEGTYGVGLTVSNGETTAASSKTFVVAAAGPGPGPGPAATKTLLLPWIATAKKPVQASDLAIHNPGTAAVELTLEFRRRGTPEDNPPRVTRTLAPGATLFAADALKSLFQLQDVSGFLLVKAVGEATPVVTSLDTTAQKNLRTGFALSASELGRTVPAVRTLAGLNTDKAELSYFGVSNPNPQPATCRLRFFNAAGREIGRPQDLALPAFGQRQFQPKEVQRDLGVSGSDYRVQVEAIAGGPVDPYGFDMRLGSSDLTFLAPRAPDAVRTWLVGVLRSPGRGGTLVRSDLVLVDPGAQPLQVDVTFIAAGAAASPTAPVSISLQAGETRRIVDVLNSLWRISSAAGVLVFTSRDPSGALPIVQAETYDNAKPARRVGQAMASRGAFDLADPGQTQILAGLRRDGSAQTTVWLYNPAGSPGAFDLVYRAVDGTLLGRIDGVAVPPGGALQIVPGQHPAGVQGVFTLQALVLSGKLQSAAQVVMDGRDTVYFAGEKR